MRDRQECYEHCATKTYKHRITSPNSVSSNTLPTRDGLPIIRRGCARKEALHTQCARCKP